MRTKLLTLLLAATVSGCVSVTPAGVALNQQNHQAATEGASIGEEVVKRDPELEPLIRPMIVRFDEIRMNSESLAVDIGVPDEESPFSPARGSELRHELAQQVRRRAFWKVVGRAGVEILGAVACNSGIPGAGIAFGLLTGGLTLTAAAGAAAEIIKRKSSDA